MARLKLSKTACCLQGEREAKSGSIYLPSQRSRAVATLAAMARRLILPEFNSMLRGQMFLHVWGICSSTWEERVALVTQAVFLSLSEMEPYSWSLPSLRDSSWLKEMCVKASLMYRNVMWHNRTWSATVLGNLRTYKNNQYHWKVYNSDGADGTSSCFRPLTATLAFIFCLPSSVSPVYKQVTKRLVFLLLPVAYILLVFFPLDGVSSQGKGRHLFP